MRFRLKALNCWFLGHPFRVFLSVKGLSLYSGLPLPQTVRSLSTYSGILAHGAMLLFSAVVAGSFSLGHIIANDITPAALTALRFMLAAVVMAIWTWRSCRISRPCLPSYLCYAGTKTPSASATRKCCITRYWFRVLFLRVANHRGGPLCLGPYLGPCLSAPHRPAAKSTSR